jgi:hypothetical protein
MILVTTWNARETLNIEDMGEREGGEEIRDECNKVDNKEKQRETDVNIKTTRPKRNTTSKSTYCSHSRLVLTSTYFTIVTKRFSSNFV